MLSTCLGGIGSSATYSPTRMAIGRERCRCVHGFCWAFETKRLRHARTCPQTDSGSSHFLRFPLTQVLAFSVLLHGFGIQWWMWGAMQFGAISAEKLAGRASVRPEGSRRLLGAAANQTFAMMIQLVIFYPFSLVSTKQGECVPFHPTQTIPPLAGVGACMHACVRARVRACVCGVLTRRCRRIAPLSVL